MDPVIGQKRSCSFIVTVGIHFYAPCMSSGLGPVGCWLLFSSISFIICSSFFILDLTTAPVLFSCNTEAKRTDGDQSAGFLNWPLLNNPIIQMVVPCSVRDTCI